MKKIKWSRADYGTQRQYRYAWNKYEITTWWGSNEVILDIWTEDADDFLNPKRFKLEEIGRYKSIDAAKIAAIEHFVLLRI